MNKLYFGDNLDILRKHVKDESVDLVYLDPPFNSNANYNVLFSERSGSPSEAQAEAFRDSWGWGEAAAIAYDEIEHEGGEVNLLMQMFKTWFGKSAMTAYLAMMAIRLIELRRVLKPTGSIYLHCDPTASHYLKLILDAVFGTAHFQNEIVWLRTNAHNMKTKTWIRQNDYILYYTRSEAFTFNTQYMAYSEAQMSRYKKDDAGRYYKAENLTFSTANASRQFEWRGSKPPKNRSWGYAKDKLEELLAEGRILLKRDGTPRLDGLKVYLEDMKGKPCGTNWTDISRIGNTSDERLGYPTQKPRALLERIISASSNPGDVILDPFCGCGTTVEAAEHSKRQWIGIDVSHYAVSLIQSRLDRYPEAKYEVSGRPTDLAGAQDLARRDKYQFQWWAAWLLGAQTYESKKGADRGIDASIFFANGPYGLGRIIVSVKGGENVSPVWVRELAGVVEREKADMGVLITLNDPTKAMMSDSNGYGFVPKSAHGRLPRIQIATVGDLLDQRFPKLPPLPQPLPMTPRTKAAKQRDQLEMLLPFSTKGVVTPQGVFIDPRYLDIGVA